MKIKAALIVAPHTPFQIEEVDLQEPKDGEVLIQLAACGVCHSDYHVVTGDTKQPMPVVTGHDGLAAIRVAAAIERSLASGREAMVAEHEAHDPV